MNNTQEPENILLEEATRVANLTDESEEEFEVDVQARHSQTTNRINAFKKHREQGKTEKHSWYLAFQEYPKI